MPVILHQGLDLLGLALAPLGPAAKATKLAKKRTAQAEAASQRAAKKANFFAPRTRSSAKGAVATSAASSRSATTTTSSSVPGTPVRIS